MATSLTLQNDPISPQGYLKVNGTTAATITTSGITGNLVGNVTGSLTAGGSLTLATAQTASGTSVDFTGIPSWAKRITVMFNGISTNGSSNYLLQLGTSTGITTSGYLGACNYASTAVVNPNNGLIIQTNIGVSSTSFGSINILLISGNNWISSGIIVASNVLNSGSYSGGSVLLSGTFDRIRITTVNGTDTFDAGTINISYEG